jgi:uncharacterized protein with von Willebrand factor type A (vWA) domain
LTYPQYPNIPSPTRTFTIDELLDASFAVGNAAENQIFSAEAAKWTAEQNRRRAVEKEVTVDVLHRYVVDQAKLLASKRMKLPGGEGA